MQHAKKITCSVLAAVSLIVTGVVPNDVKVSPAGLKLIGNAESCQLAPYVCPAGLITDGIGNTHNVSGEVITIEKVAEDWARNIESAQYCLAASVNMSALSQGQVDAFTSFIFNVGCTRYRHNADGSETQIYQKIKAGRFIDACHELNRWIYGGGKKLNGLIKRRAEEMELCLS